MMRSQLQSLFEARDQAVSGKQAVPEPQMRSADSDGRRFPKRVLPLFDAVPHVYFIC